MSAGNRKNDNERKAKIRQRYKGISKDELTIIPATPVDNIFESNVYKRVAVYARVSTDDPNQTSSYELQKNYYEDLVKRHPNWELVEIYADEGISGTSLNHRDSFVRMIKDCQKGMIDIVITKSVSRFARNVEDCIHYARQLKALSPQVGILFETEGIYTLNDNSEMQLAFLATLAQEESHNKSQGMNRSIEMRFERGIFLTPVLLGYDHDEDGNLIINEEEAKTVRLIFTMYLAGETCNYIAETLTKLERTTKKNHKVWAPGSVYGILKNERYCGDVLARKTYTPDYLTHKSVKNNKKRPQYYQEDHHEAIISREDFIATQRLMDSNKYGFRNALPELKVMKQGVLKGFVEFNPCWRGFKEGDYLEACHSCLSDEDYLNPIVQFRYQKGDFDFRSYQVTRGQFVSNVRKVSVNITYSHMKFSTEAVKELNVGAYVELLYHPLFEIMVVRKSQRKNRHSVKWAVFREERWRSSKISGAAFLPILFQLCDWNKDNRYMVDGYLKEQDGEKILVFYMDEPIVRVKKEDKYKDMFLEEWQDEFGSYYYDQYAKDVSIFCPEQEWNISQEGVIANTPEFQIRKQHELKLEYQRMIQELVQERTKDGRTDGENGFGSL